jgi:hypothetical protein
MTMVRARDRRTRGDSHATTYCHRHAHADAPHDHLSLPLAIGVFWLAPKMRSNPWFWAVLFLIPGVNLFAVQIFLIRVAGRIFDRLNAIAPVAATAKPE